MAIQIDIPAQYNTYHEKWAYIAVLEKQMSDLYSTCVSWHNDGGMSQGEYDSLPSWIRRQVPFSHKLGRVGFRKVMRVITNVGDRVQNRKQLLRRGVYDASMDCVLDRDIIVS